MNDSKIRLKHSVGLCLIALVSLGGYSAAAPIATTDSTAVTSAATSATTAPIALGPVVRRKGELILADATGAHSAIVVADNPLTAARDAATIFQTLAQRTTGALLPIVAESRYNPKNAAVFIGDSQAVRRKGVVVAQDPIGEDHYVMRSGRTWLALVGNDTPFTSRAGDRTHRGSAYAVYDFFQRHGCGWYGPEELWQVVPSLKVLSTPALKVEETAAFTMRDIWLLRPHPVVSDAWRMGGLFLEQGHAYDALVPPVPHKAEHPEWFGPSQPDLTRPEVIQIAVQNLSERLKAHPADSLATFSVGANDTEGFIDKPFKPEVGNIAAQQLYFANEIAKGLRRLHPGRKFLLTGYAYWHSHDGPVPMLQAEPEVVMMLINEGNHAKPLEWPETEEFARSTGRNNTREMNAFARWKQTGGLKAIYEWWIPVLANPVWKQVPWYDGDTAVRNLRFWKRNGIRYMTYETQAEANGGFPLRWAQYYVGSRAMWNPNIDPDRVLSEACVKLYGPAAGAMTSFYELQQRAMRTTTEAGGNWALPRPHLLYTPVIEATGDLLLTQAANALGKTVPDDRMRARVEVERKQWQAMKDANATARATPVKTFGVVLDGRRMEFSRSTIDAATVLSLFGSPNNTPLEVLERDGQNRAAVPGENYDLQAGITFRTKSPAIP